MCEADGAAAAGAAGCAAVYGVDFMIDRRGKAWLLEVQMRPQMDIACPEDGPHKDRLVEGILENLIEGKQRGGGGGGRSGRSGRGEGWDGEGPTLLRQPLLCEDVAACPNGTMDPLHRQARV